MESSVNLDDELADMVQDVEDFLSVTEEARFAAERNRDYKDNKQWTVEEKRKVESRGQAAITVNRIKPKVEGLKGLLIQRKTDPKAYPRTPKHEQAAEMVTDALRYVADNNDFDDIKLAVADNFFVEGYGAAITQVVNKGNQKEIECTDIPWDRYYYDIHSRRLDFADKRWDGIILWLDEDVVKESFGLDDIEVENLYNTIGDGDETFDDRPRWSDRKDKRIRICQHFYIRKGEWMTCFFTQTAFLIKPMKSPYVDEFNQPMNPIESVSANIDRDNNRFGEVSYWTDLQDEINHRRSKYLFLLSSRQTQGRKGSIADIAAMKRELSKPDGHVEYEGDKGDFDIIKTNDMAQAQFTLLQDSKAELDAVGFNAQLSGERQGDLSGKAITNLQQAATNELSSQYQSLTNWEKRMYRQMWFRIKQFWDQEKWIRVTDDATKLKWVGFNTPVTLQMKLEENSRDEALPIPARMQIAQQLQMMMQQQNPVLNQIVEIKNNIAELDMDIIIETSYDIINVQREQFELLAKIAQTRPDIPFTEIIKLSELRGKDKLISQMEQNAQASSKMQQEKTQTDIAETQSKAQLNMAKQMKEMENARKLRTDAELTELQAHQLVDNPPENSSVVI